MKRILSALSAIALLAGCSSSEQSAGKVTDVLLEPHVAAEETKQGFSSEEIMGVVSDYGKYAYVRFKGIMGMATFTDDQTVICKDFGNLRDIRDAVLDAVPSIAEDFTELSIGMSDDYHIAIGYGSTMVRIGSMIFGSRM